MPNENSVSSQPRRLGRPPKYKWDEMAVGDSFLVTDRRQGAMLMTAKYQSARLGCTFKAVTTDDGVRVTRIA